MLSKLQEFKLNSITFPYKLRQIYENDRRAFVRYRFDVFDMLQKCHQHLNCFQMVLNYLTKTKKEKKNELINLLE